MSRSTKLIALVLVLLALAAVGLFSLRGEDPTAFASGKRVDLADFQGTTLPASPQASRKLISLHAVNISLAPPIAPPATRRRAASLCRGPRLQASHDRHDLFAQHYP